MSFIARPPLGNRRRWDDDEDDECDCPQPSLWAHPLVIVIATTALQLGAEIVVRWWDREEESPPKTGRAKGANKGRRTK